MRSSACSPQAHPAIDRCDALADARQGLPGASVYGCLMKTASVEILEAAIRLVMAGGQCFPSEQALQAPAQNDLRVAGA